LDGGHLPPLQAYQRDCLKGQNMTDPVRIDENSPEAVAYKLLRDIAVVEGRIFERHPREGRAPVDRRWLLDTYRECIRAVQETNATASGRGPSRG
jgi:hypothetical protein